MSQLEWDQFVSKLSDTEVNELRTALDREINIRVCVRDVWQKEADEGMPPSK